MRDATLQRLDEEEISLCDKEIERLELELAREEEKADICQADQELAKEHIDQKTEALVNDSALKVSVQLGKLQGDMTRVINDIACLSSLY